MSIFSLRQITKIILKGIILLFFLLYLSIGNTYLTAATKHDIVYFQGNKKGAVSITFDDGYTSQVTNAFSQLNMRNLKGTLFTITSSSWTAGHVSWATINQIAGQGHEIASHTVNHYYLTSLTDSDLRWQLNESQRMINRNVPSQSCVSFAYPYGDLNQTVKTVTSEYYFAARGVSSREGGLNYYEDGPAWRVVDFYNIGSYAGSDNMSYSDIDGYLNAAEERHAWMTFNFHSINDSAAFAQFLDYLLTKNVWIGTLGSIVRYMRERQASTLAVLSESNEEIKLSLINSLDQSIYDQPLTLRSAIPSDWSRVLFQQGENSYVMDSRLEGGDTVIYYDVVPNGGPISLTPSGINPLEIVTAPSTPGGSSSGIAGTSYTYSTGGSSSTLGHAVEYQFDWKGDETDLSSWASASQAKTWAAAGIYNVRARARCATDTGTISSWSSSIAIKIAPYQPSVLPLLNLDFEEGSGSTALDSSGLGNNGIIAGATYNTDSAVGSYALSFNGNGSVTVPGNGSLKPDTMSIAIWVKHTSDTTSSYGGIIQGAYGNGYGTGFRILDFRNQALAEMNFGDSGPIWIYGSYFVQGAWCHLVLTYDHVKIRLYQNGVLIREIAETRNINWQASPGNLIVGLAQWYFRGAIDKVSLFNYALSPQEIVLLYSEKSNPVETVSAPSTPSGPGSGFAGISYTYSTGGSSSSLGHAVEYQLDWKGDGTDLSAWGSTPQTKTWTVAGTYLVRARARCATDTGTVSSWSGSLTINITQAQISGSLLNMSFEEGGGSTALDSSGRGNNGIIAGATYTTDSAVGAYALSFNGNGSVTVPGNGSLKPDSMSIALWVKHTNDTTSSYGGIIQGAYGNGYSTGFRILDFGNQALAEMNFGDSGPIWIYGSYFVQGAWCHLVLTYDHVKIRLYQNGVLIREIAETRNINWQASPGNLIVGLAQWYFRGAIDKVSLFNYALSPQEIALLYSEKSNPVETVSAPSAPSGPGSGFAGISYTYSTGDSSSSLGHAVEYQFDWKGDGTDLSAWGSMSQNKTWAVAGTYNVRARARCTKDPGTVSSWSTAALVNITSAQVFYIVTTNPSGLKVTVDGVAYTAPQTFNWDAGSLHTLSAASPQTGTPGIQYIYNSWSDNGSQIHNITAPASTTTYTASFATQYTLTTSANPSGGGTINPAGAIWGNSGQSVSISATANTGYRFVGWSGDLSGSSNPSSITLSGPKSVVANFETVIAPSTPSGPGSGIAGISYTYSTGGSSSNLGHAVEYQFDWKGDGTDLSSWGSASQTKTWAVAGVYHVRARARCTADTGTISSWSGSSAINITQAQTLVSLLNMSFEEGSGSAALDSSGLGNNGIIAGATYTTDSAVGSYALSFNGNGTVTVPGNGSLKPDSMSIALWIKHTANTASSYGGIIQGAYGNGYSRGFRILDYRNQALAEMNFGDSGPIWIYGSPFIQGAWCHLVLTYDHVKIRFYQNGILVREIAETRNINWQTSASNLTIGLAQWSFKGAIDKVSLFNYALSPQEIALLYNKNW